MILGRVVGTLWVQGWVRKMEDVGPLRAVPVRELRLSGPAESMRGLLALGQ